MPDGFGLDFTHMAIGKVIKGESAPEGPIERPAIARPRGVLQSEDYEARQSAQAILADAKARAEAMLSEAQAKREEYIAQGREEGRQEQLSQGTEILARAHQQRDEVLATSQNEVLLLACSVAEKIIGADLERSPEIIVEICATAIETARRTKALVLHVHPKDATVLRAREKALMQRIGQTLSIGIKEDSDVPRGGCIIHTDTATLDARLETQIEMLRRVLLEGDVADDAETSE
ncbi:MAG: FliH/SctL family protein [Myxococcaceae bacterium]